MNKNNTCIVFADSLKPQERYDKLISIFHKSNEEATQIMLHVHQKGIGVCGSYPREVAETKVLQVLDNAKKNEHPLQCSMKKV